jgi:hypothetical protein
MPDEIFTSPLGDLAREYVRLRDAQHTAVDERSAISGMRGPAEQADRDALRAAMAAGEPDPGNESTVALEHELAVADRKIQGLTDASTEAFALLVRALKEGLGAEWLEALRLERASLAGDVVGHLEAAASLSSGQLARVRAVLRWTLEAADPDRHRRLPSGYKPSAVTILGRGGNEDVHHVLEVMMNAFREDALYLVDEETEADVRGNPLAFGSRRVVDEQPAPAGPTPAAAAVQHDTRHLRTANELGIENAEAMSPEELSAEIARRGG